MAEPPHPDPEARTEAAPLVDARQPQPTTGLEEARPLVAGRYEILGMLGAGGMGTVYRARDRELEETVALKILRKELASSATMLERFRREVKLARRVTHRNVARTFDIGEHGGDRFLTMELIEGEMLGAHLARRGRVPLDEVIAIARDLCAGLTAAHAAGVLHRDLKPENVIIAGDGRAVITDFGIARVVADGELRRTAAGGMVGTPAYMAPEQVEGLTDLDARTDLYALGTMLFELLTGKLAWPGDSIVAVAAARLLRPPPDARAHVPDVPESAAELVKKLMARSRNDRFSSAEEAGNALAALQEAALAAPKALLPSIAVPDRTASPHLPSKSVAVLPMLNMSVRDDDYLAQCVTEDLVDLLSMVRELRVRPRGDTAPYALPSRDVREAGRSLGVDVVVDGSVRRHDEVIRVSVRLITVADGFQLWARRFDRPAGQILTVADEAAASIAHALAAELTASARPVAADPVAQDMYLRGRYLIHRGWFEVSRDGVALLRDAHARAPDDTRIAGTLALGLAKTLAGQQDPLAALAEARQLAEGALARDPAQSEARVALGFVHLAMGDGAAAAAQLKLAVRVAPNSVEALDGLGRVLVEVGAIKVGIASMRRALAIDPSVNQARLSIARVLALIGDHEGSLEVLGPPPRLPSDFTPYMLARARIALWSRDANVAALLQDMLDGAGTTAAYTAEARRSIAGLLHVARTGVAPPTLPAAMAYSLPLDGRSPPRTLSFFAQLRAELKIASGDVEGAFADLQVGNENGLLDVSWMDLCPIFEGLRDRPDFKAIRETTAARAERVLAVIEPETLMLGH